MSSPPLVSAAVMVFIIAALLFWQMKQQRLEHFVSPPVAGRPYGAVGEMPTNSTFNPADLNRLPPSNPARPSEAIPTSVVRPATVPGPATSVRDPPAQRKDMEELHIQLTTWLHAADQREHEHPGSLTPEQRQQRVLYESRATGILDQLGSGHITDTTTQVRQELDELTKENAIWHRMYPSVEKISSFGVNDRQELLLSAEQYDEFRGLLDAVLLDMREHPQTDPLMRIRFQQLEVFLQELQSAEKKYTVPPIKMRAARLFIQRAQRADQPLPTLFALDSIATKPLLSELSTDIPSIIPLEKRTYTTDEITELRRQIASNRNRASPSPFGAESNGPTEDPLTHRLTVLRSLLPQGADITAMNAVMEAVKSGRLTTAALTYWRRATSPGITIPPEMIDRLRAQTRVAKTPTERAGLELLYARARAGMIQADEYDLLTKQMKVVKPPRVSADSEAPTVISSVQMPAGYDPTNPMDRARNICKQVSEAFPNAAYDLGCPVFPQSITTPLQAQNTMNLVCDSLRYSVPSVNPEQYGCPPRSGLV